MKVLAYLLNPKALLAVFLFDITGVLHFINKYIFEDVTYLKFLVVACVVDLITALTKVWVTQGLSAITSRGLRDTISKGIQYGSFLIITHVLTHFQINGESNSQFLWLNKVAYEFLILIEIKSVYENIIKINPKLNFVDTVIKKFLDIIRPKKD